MDADLKAQADALFTELGMNLTTAFKVPLYLSPWPSGYQAGDKTEIEEYTEEEILYKTK